LEGAMGKTKDLKVVANNKKAYHDYFVEETLECGIALWGNEVKSVKAGKISIKESWVDIKNGEMTLVGCHITRWDTANTFDVEERRERKLLAHKKEISKYANAIKLAGYTLVPLKVYVVDGLCKVEVGLCKGKHNYDKREDLKKKDAQREIARNLTSK
jgi:SsrA-binding protein